MGSWPEVVCLGIAIISVFLVDFGGLIDKLGFIVLLRLN